MARANAGGVGVEVQPDRDLTGSRSWRSSVMLSCLTPRYGASGPRVRSTSMAESWAISGRRPAPGPAPATPGAGRRWRPRCARPCGTAGCAPGTRLPSSRALAADLGIARNTVADAYGQLVAEGWLAARQGSGTWVAERGRAPAARPRPPPPAAARRAALRPAARLPDLSPRSPRAAWLAAGRAARWRPRRPRRPRLRRPARPPGAARRAGRLPGPRPRRRVDPGPASWSAPASPRGWRCSARCCGRGARARWRSRRYGQQLHRRHRGGAGLAAARAAGRRRRRRGSAQLDAAPDALLLTPAHQFPLGVPLAPARRRRAVDWAGRTRRRWSSRTTTTASSATTASRSARMQALGARARRLRRHRQQEPRARPAAGLAGRCPPALVDEVVAAKAAADRQPSSPGPAHPGRADRLRRLRPAGPPGPAASTGAAGTGWSPRCARRAPQVQVTGIAAGLHALLRLPPGRAEDEVAGRAAGTASP